MNTEDELKEELRKNYGANAPRHYWRNLQKAVHEAHESFHPEGYDKYWEDHGKSFNIESISIMTSTEKTIQKFVRSTMEKNYPSGKWVQEIPKKVFTVATTEASKHQYETGENIPVWNFFGMDALREIVLYGNNWSSHFEKFFTLKSEIKKSGGKKAKTEWMQMIDKLQKNVGKATFSVAKSEYETLKEVETLLTDMTV